MPSALKSHGNPPMHVMLENVRSVYNVGSVFRTCDSAGVTSLHLTGYTAIPPHPRLQKTALGSTQSVNWFHHCQSLSAALFLKSQGIQLISFETVPGATSLFDYHFNAPSCLIFGHEETGITPDLLELSDHIIRIPQFGIKESLNIASAAAVAIYECRRQLNL
jgi:23S rRNA (guanosine2251-2'-O)-methyltransferase